MVWTVLESRQTIKILEKLPEHILRKYQFWLNMLQTQGTEAIKKFPGFKDEKLHGKWDGFRSSRLNDQYRVIYRIDANQIMVFVEKIDPHTYRR